MCNTLIGGGNCSWVIILILILLFCDNGSSNSCGCVANNCGCSNNCGCGC
ncbi:MAG: hypothetical protein IJF20_03300 [Clostridia bacterium]|nr:hypothetical protein [Clostridia bacterium]